MAAQLTSWERRGPAERAEFGTRAFELCRAMRAQDGVTNCRFFWTGPDSIVVLTEAESQHVLDDPPKPEVAQALFTLADLGRQTATQRWIDPRDGQDAYTIAGRL